MTSEPRRTISLYAELTSIAAALEAHHMLLRDGRNLSLESLDDAFHSSKLFSSASFSVGLILERVHLLKAAVVGAVDPLLVWNSENSVGKRRPEDDPDLFLKSWDAKQRAEYARRELRLVHQVEARTRPAQRPRRGRKAKSRKGVRHG